MKTDGRKDTVWANSPGSSQVTEIVEVGDAHWPLFRLVHKGDAGIEHGNSLRSNDLGCLGKIGWVLGTEFATGC